MYIFGHEGRDFYWDPVEGLPSAAQSRQWLVPLSMCKWPPGICIGAAWWSSGASAATLLA